MKSYPPCPLQPGASVWLYLRDSGGDGQDTASQEAFVFGYCEHYRLNIARVFRDAAQSGGTVAGRDEFMLMIETARRSKAPLVEAIIYWDTKRFSRNPDDAPYYKADLRRRKYRLISLTDNIPDGLIGRPIEALLEWKAAQDLEDLRKDVKRGMQFLVGLKGEDGQYIGVFPGAAPTFFTGKQFDTGLVRNDGKSRIVQRLVPDPETWELGRQAWQMRSEQASYQRIEQELNLFPGNANPAGTYSHIFGNEIYIGRMHYGGRVYEGFVPALATPEQWEAVAALRYKCKKGPFPAGKKHPKAGRPKYLLSGLCKCIYCQSSMNGETNNRRNGWQFYRCRSKKTGEKKCPASIIPAHRLENGIVNAVCGHILMPAFVEQLVERTNAYLADDDRARREREVVEAELGKLNKVIDNLLRMAEMTPSLAIARQIEAREAERAAAERRLAQLEEEARQTEITTDMAEVVDVLAGQRETLISGQTLARQNILREYIERIEAGGNVARLHYKVDLYGLCLKRVNRLEVKDILTISI